MKRLALTLIATIGLSVSPVFANGGLTNLTTQTDSYQTGIKLSQITDNAEKYASQAVNTVVNKAKVAQTKLTKQADQSEDVLEKMANNTQDKAQSFKQGFDDGGDNTF